MSLLQSEQEWLVTKNRIETKFKLNRDIEININFLMSTAHMMRGEISVQLTHHKTRGRCNLASSSESLIERPLFLLPVVSENKVKSES